MLKKLQHKLQKNHSLNETDKNDKIKKDLLKLWEVDGFFKCPIMGICLTHSEQKKLLKKINIPIKKKSYFEIHEILISSLNSKNDLSQKIDNILKCKFKREKESLLGLSENEFQNYFKIAFEAGDYAGVMWATAINPNLSAETKREIYGEIHMATFLNNDNILKLKQKIFKQQEKIDKLYEETKGNIKLRRTLQKENKILKKDKEEIKKILCATEQEKNELKEKLVTSNNKYNYGKNEQKKETINKKLLKAKLNIQNSQDSITSLKEKNLQLLIEIEQQKKINQLIKNKMKKTVTQFFHSNSCDASCPSFDLCKKRILLVGGLQGMEALYREVIEKSGGVFDYHSGYVKKKPKKLEACLKRADMVVCPVNCNSHGACSIIKSLAKKHKKKLHMLSNSSLHSVSQAIWGSNKGGTINKN